MPHKISRFWQELKRRNVVRVLTVYAGAAFVIIELINNITEPLRLPEWTPTLVIVLLAIGFPVVIIFSWIYDVHPEGGIVKTEPAEKAKAEEVPKPSNGWKIASYISFVVIVGLIVLNIIPRAGATQAKEVLEKSIAVLPFENDSPDSDNAYYLKGYWTTVHSNLCKIKDIRVLTLQSTEQYSNQSKTIPEIAKELGVGYLLSARGQIINNRVRLNVYLTNANDEIIWSNPYDRQIEVVDDHINIQSEIAQLVARELEAVITPEEKHLIEKIPTTDLTAYDFYQRGNEEFQKYSTDNTNRTALEKAEHLFREALRSDSTFAQAYSGLGFTYWEKHFSDEFFSESFMDSALILADIALFYDKELPDAYLLRGTYYRENGEMTRAEEEFDKGIRYNPNDWSLYFGKAIIYSYDEQVNCLDNLYKAASLNRGPELTMILQSIGSAYTASGCIEKAFEINEEVLRLTGDTAAYYRFLGNIQMAQGNYIEGNEFYVKANRLDSTYFLRYHNLGLSFLKIGEEAVALDCYKKYQKYYESTGDIENLLWNYHRIGYAYWANGFRDEAEYYFHKLLESSTREIMLGRFRSEQYYAYYDIASVYAFLGRKEEAYENLRIFNQKKNIQLWMLDLITADPLFNSIRDEPEFQQILSDVEAKYQAEHERVRQWLEENML